VHHPFDGDGMITALRFAGGSAELRNRFVRTEGWLAEEQADRVLYRGVFGTQKPGGPLANAFDLRLKNIANTHVVRLGDQLLALWEAAFLPIATDAVVELTPAGHGGLAMALFSQCFAFSALVAPVVTGVLLDSQRNGVVLWLLTAVACGACLLLLPAISQQARRRSLQT
jgi:hypothetical protein